MHRTANRMEAWIAAAILVLTLSPSRSDAQESLLRKSFEALGRSISSGSTDSMAQASEGAQDPADTAAETTELPQNSLESRRMLLVVGQSKSLSLPTFVRTVHIDNPTLVDAKVNKRNLNELFVTALEPGIAQVDVTDKTGQTHRIHVMISKDAAPLQQALAELYPESNIKVIPAGNDGVIITGQVEDAQAVDPIIALAEKFFPEGGVINALKVVGPQQVQLHVMIAEVSRTKLRALGFNFLFSDGSDYFTSTVGNLLTMTSVTRPSGLGFTFSPENNVTFGKITNAHTFRGFLRALKEEGLVKVVAEPTLTTFSGRASSMIVGGEFPIIVPEQQGTFHVQFREYGNRLDFVPIVLGGGRIRLEVRPELSELDFANGVVMAGFTIPALKQRRVDTSVQLNSGETFVIGGLISTLDTATTNKVPYLGDLAVIGSAFRTMSYNQEEKELVIMVTPELVEPLKPGQKPCAYPGSESNQPSDHELYWLGNLESPACNPCEITRRSMLGVQVGHGHAKKTSAGARAIVDAPKPSAEQPATVEAPAKPQPTDAQRLSTAPGLIGPIGYDAGR